MSQVVAAPPPSPPRRGRTAPSPRTRSGLPAVLFCIVTGAAPLAAMMFNVPVAVSGGGYAVPAAFLVATVALTIFSTGYIEMSQRVTSTGGFYTFISRGLGNVPRAGLRHPDRALLRDLRRGRDRRAAATSRRPRSTTGSASALPACVYMFGALALMTGFAWFHIELTARILGVALVAEVLALLVMCVGIIVTGGGPDGYSAAPLNPANLFDNDAAIEGLRRRGGRRRASSAPSGPGSASRWRPTTPRSRASRTRSPRRATYGSVIGLGVFYIFVSYMFVTGWGLTGSAQAVADQFEGKYASAFYPLTDKYVGSGLTTILAAPDHHELVRLRDGLLQHRRALPVLARPRGRAAARARPRRTPSATGRSSPRWS